MIPSPWHCFLHSLPSFVKGRQPAHRQGRRKQRTRVRPRVELLENRTLMAASVDLTSVYHFQVVLSAEELFRDLLDGEKFASVDPSTVLRGAAPQGVNPVSGSEGGAATGGSSTNGTGTPTAQTAEPANQSPQQSLLEAMAVGSGHVAGAASPLAGLLNTLPAETQPVPGAAEVPATPVTPTSLVPDSPGVGEAGVDGNAAMQAFFSNGLRFETNVGQFDSPINFVARGEGYSVALTPTGAVLAIQPGEASDGAEAVAVGMEIVGGNPHAEPVGEGLLPGITNYLSSDPALNHTEIASYGQVRYHEVYTGIDLVYRTSETGELEYDFVASAGADPGQIALSFHGADRVSLNDTGGLVLHTAAGDLVQHAPFTFQVIDGQQREVASRFVLTDGEVRFDLGEYDHSHELVIDPKWGYSTYLGGDRIDEANGVAVQSTGTDHFAYVVGSTFSAAFRPGPNPKNPTVIRKAGVLTQPGETRDVFVAKINTAGNDLVYLTYIIGSESEEGLDIAVDPQGNAYITGRTFSPDLKMVNAWQGTYRGDRDAFAAKLNQNGTDFVFSTYLGGNSSEDGYGITIDSQQRVYVVGSTNSDKFNNVNPDKKLGALGSIDAFLVRLESNGGNAKVVFMGGNAVDVATAVAVDNADPANAYVTGRTKPGTGVNHFPTTQGAWRRDPVGDQDAFVAKVSFPAEAAPDLAWSTIVGGVWREEAHDIAIDPSNDSLYVVGSTQTQATVGFKDQNNAAYKPATTLGTAGASAVEGQAFSPDAWVLKLNNQGVPPDQAQGGYFAYIRGRDKDEAKSIALTSGTNAKLFVGGSTYSNNGADGFPAAQANGTLQPFRGEQDGFVAYLNPAVSGNDSLLFNTYVGGSGVDVVQGVAVDSAGNVYAAGMTLTKNFRPAGGLVPGFQSSIGGPARDPWDGFAVKIEPNPLANQPPKQGALGNPAGNVGDPVTFTATATDPNDDPLTFGLDGAPSGASIDPSTGDFSWTPSSEQVGAHTFFVQVWDPDGAFDEQAITAVIAPSGSGPDVPGDALAAGLLVNFLDGVKAEVAASIGDGPYANLDVDLFRLDLLAGQQFTADIDAQLLDDGTPLSSLDSVLRVFDASGNELAFNDDANDPDTGVFSFDAALTFTAPADDTYYVGVSGFGNAGYDPTVAGSGASGSTGDYRLQLLVRSLTPPVVDVGPDATIDEGNTFSGFGLFTDPDSETWTASIDYGDGSGVQELSLSPDNTFDLSHVYADNGAYTVTVTVTDGEGQQGTDTVVVTVENVAPTAEFANNGPVNAGDPLSVSFANQFDPSSADTGAGFRYSYDWDNDGIFDDVEVTDAALDHVFAEPGEYLVAGRIQDKDGGFTDYWTDVFVGGDT